MITRIALLHRPSPGAFASPSNHSLQTAAIDAGLTTCLSSQFKLLFALLGITGLRRSKIGHIQTIFRAKTLHAYLAEVANSGTALGGNDVHLSCAPALHLRSGVSPTVLLRNCITSSKTSPPRLASKLHGLSPATKADCN